MLLSCFPRKRAGRRGSVPSRESLPPRGRQRRTVLLVVAGLVIATALLQQPASTADYSSVLVGYESLFSNSTQAHDASSSDASMPRKPTTGTPDDHNNSQSRTNTMPVPQNLRLVFVGDSLSRYLYLSLVYYLKTNGHWAPPGHELLEKVKDSSPDAWNQWLAFTNRHIQYEECDCYRYWTHPFKWYKHCENRYYHFGTNYVAFITKFGGNPFHGHVAASQVFAPNRHGANQTLRHYDWVVPTWDRLVDEYIAHWKPKPNLLVFNQGHWKAHELREETVLQSFRRTLKKHGIRGIYRTTTYRQEERVVDGGNAVAAFANASTRRHDALVCQYFDCWNVSWTATLPTTDYVDPVHFKAPINNRMNQQFLQEFLVMT